MGVIKKADHTVNIRTSISEETLYIPSSDDEPGIPSFEEGRPRRHPRILRHHIPTVGPSVNGLKNHSGKKKSRRYFNASELMTLAEEDELQEVTIDDFVENTKSAFTVLLEDDKNLKKWDEFVESSEEKQNQFISEHRKKRNKNSQLQYKINVALRNLLRKNNLPIGMLQYLEDELVNFFLAMPTKTYVSRQLNSFERLLLHSVSDYHRLKSLSFDSEPEGVRLVRVKNPRKEFPSPPLLLAQYVETIRRESKANFKTRPITALGFASSRNLGLVLEIFAFDPSDEKYYSIPKKICTGTGKKSALCEKLKKSSFIYSTITCLLLLCFHLLKKQKIRHRNTVEDRYSYLKCN